ncbi:hypothetical protein FOCC_FOCC001491, partial [Frankliniella occidentalis]
MQQLVGVYITIYYAVTFFQETHSELDPYIATICIGVVRLVGCTSTSLIMQRVGRRPLMLLSSVGQCVAMAVSGYATYCIRQGNVVVNGFKNSERRDDPAIRMDLHLLLLPAEAGSVSSWWVVMGLLVYIAFGCLGWQIIPWSMMAELFPHRVRGLAQPINSGVAHLLMFAMLQVYPALDWLV